MLQNSMLIMAMNPFSDKDEMPCWENRPFTKIGPELQQHSSKEITKTIKKKPKRVRTAFTTEQLRVLEKMYCRSKYIDAEHRRELADCLKIGEKSIKIWFQNRRMKEKKDSSETSCDSSTESCTDAISLPLNIQCNHQITESSSFIPFIESNYYPVYSEVPQYQLPVYNNNTGYIPEMQYQNEGTPNTMLTSMSFCNDTNIYPTQYYPSGVQYYSNMDGVQYQYVSENFWSSDNFELSYL